MSHNRHPLAILSSLVLLGACTPDPVPVDDDDATEEIATGEGLFLNGCPTPGASFARLLTDPDERPWGETAIAAPGDVLLANERAAWVIAAPGVNPRTWYHYGGVPIDAVPVDGCAQAGPERFGVVGWLVGQLELTDIPASTLRMFRGESVEIVSDGSNGGPAIVDVVGVDDRFWLAEYELLKEAYLEGQDKPLTSPYGLTFTVRYTLDPDDPVLDVQLRLTGESADGDFLVASLLFPADLNEELVWSDGNIGAGGVGLRTGAPWFAGGTPEGSWAIGVPEGIGTHTSFSGVSGFLDLGVALDPLDVSPGATAVAPFALSVGPGGTASATGPLMDHLPATFPDGQGSAVAVGGVVTDPSGDPVPGATVRIEAETDDGDRKLLDTATADADGVWSAGLAPVGVGRWWVRASAAGRDDSDAILVDAAPQGELDLVVGAHGALVVNATDGTRAIPVRVDAERSDGLQRRLWANIDGTALELPPGDWELWASRGYEHALANTTVTVPDDGSATVDLSLPVVVDTAGWASIDSHVHSEPSPDSKVDPPLRMVTAAASGLDVMISTDHEAIIDLSPAIAEAGLTDYMQTLLGSEVTAPLPEHTNAWPFPARPEVPRGDHVKWYGHTPEGIYAAERERGAQIVQLNHARVNGECGYLCVIDWDRVTGEPGLDDPAAIGLAGDEPVWSWDLDSFEVFNGPRLPFLDAASPRNTGAFEDWLSFHNLGHQVTGVAVTDRHNAEVPGQPRTYVSVGDDTPGAVSTDSLVEGMQDGAAQMSLGAFARVSVGGAGPGETGTGTTLSVRIEALPEVDVQHVTVLANCDEVAEVAATGPNEVVKLDTTLELDLDADAHVVVLAFGNNPMPRGLLNYSAAVPRVVTNPIFVDVDGDGTWTAPGGKTCDWTPAFDPE